MSTSERRGRNAGGTQGERRGNAGDGTQGNGVLKSGIFHLGVHLDIHFEIDKQPTERYSER